MPEGTLELQPVEAFPGEQSGMLVLKAQFQFFAGSISHDPELSVAANPAVKLSEWNFKVGTIALPPAGQSSP